MMDEMAKGDTITTYEKVFTVVPVKLKAGGWRWFWPVFLCKDWTVSEFRDAKLKDIYYLREDDLTVLRLQSTGHVVSKKDLKEYS